MTKSLKTVSIILKTLRSSNTLSIHMIPMPNHSTNKSTIKQMENKLMNYLLRVILRLRKRMLMFLSRSKTLKKSKDQWRVWKKYQRTHLMIVHASKRDQIHLVVLQITLSSQVKRLLSQQRSAHVQDLGQRAVCLIMIDTQPFNISKLKTRKWRLKSQLLLFLRKLSHHVLLQPNSLII